MYNGTQIKKNAIINDNTNTRSLGIGIFFITNKRSI